MEIVTEAQSFFPSITQKNFAELFRLTPLQIRFVVAGLLHLNLLRAARNVLIVCFQLKHYMPFRSGCILFGLGKTQYAAVFSQTLRNIVSSFGYLISLRNRNHDSITEFQSTATVIDCTECTAWSYGPRTGWGTDLGYSGKKKMFTLKYQVVVGAKSGTIYDVYGPIYGSVHDARILQQSGFDNFLWKSGEFCLGDRGYQGCLNIISPHKHYGASFTLSEKKHNQDISRYRDIVERVFCNLKKWTILRNPYRGELDEHFFIFMTCCIFCSL